MQEQTQDAKTFEVSGPISNEEIIHRSVQLVPQFFRWGAEGEIKISASAFNDRPFEPSFYRKDLCEHPPESTPPRMNSDDAVAAVIVEAIRKQQPILFQSGNAAEPIPHKVDVRPETIGHHPSHVVVFTAPEFKTKGGFAKLKEFLALLVAENWAIQPNPAFLLENKDQIPRR